MSYSPSMLSAFSAALARVHETAGSEPSAALPFPRDGTAEDDLAFLFALIEEHRRQAAQPRPAQPPAAPDAEAARFARLRAHGLTRRQCEVVGWIAQGKRDAEIAAILGCAPKTVGKHVEHILEILGAETRLGAAHTAEALLRINA